MTPAKQAKAAEAKAEAEASASSVQDGEVPRFPLKGSFKGDIDRGIGIGIDIDVDSDIGVSKKGPFLGVLTTRIMVLRVYFGAPIYQLVETIGPLIEAHWGV